MQIFRYDISLCLLLIVLSCNSSKPEVPTCEGFPYDTFFATDSSEFVTVDLESKLDGRDELTNYSEYVEGLSFLRLETSPQSILPQIEYCIYTDDYIYLCTGVKENVIAIFDHKGQYVNSIRAGRGPGELKQLCGAFFSSKDDELIVLSFPLELSFYSPDGKFLRNVGLSFYANSFTQLEDGYLFRAYGFPSGEKLADRSEKLVLTDLDCNVISKSVPYYDYTLLGIPPFPTYDCAFNSFYSAYPGTVYRYVDGKMIPHYRFDAGKYQVPAGTLMGKDVYELIDYWGQNDVCCFNDSFFETEDCLFVECDVRSEGVGLFVDKNSQNIIGSRARSRDIPFDFPIGTYDSQFISLVEASDVTSFVKRVKDGGEYNKDLITPEVISELEKVQPDDNPVLIMYKMKHF